MTIRPGDWRHNGGPALEIDEAPKVYIGEAFLPLFEPFRHKALFGGRGSAKSHSIAEALTIITGKVPKRVVCARQFQNSIRDSVKELLEAKMTYLRLVGKNGFRFYDREIVHEGTGSRYTFIGLDRNPDSAKSLEGADICWVEEARTINSRSMEILIPTIRKPGSELWWSWNPEQRDDPVDAYFRSPAGPPPNSFIKKVFIEDNPFFYHTELAAEMHFMQDGNFERYRHIWLGDYDDAFDTKVFSKIEIGRIEIPSHIFPKYGMDFGFGSDPCVVIKVYVLDDIRVLYIAKEAFGHSALRDVPALIDSVVEDSGDYIKADSSQPGTIEHLSSQGYNIEGARKGPGSVKAGINWIKSYKIVIDPECEHMREEARLYSWAVDRLTKRILNHPVDAHNHGWDSVRYATEDHMDHANADDQEDTGVFRMGF